MRTNPLLHLATAILLLLTTAAHSQDGTATTLFNGDNWSNPAAWNSTPAGFAPINGQNGQNWNATVIALAINVDVAVDVQSLNFRYGNITGPQSLTVNAASTWGGVGSGTMSGTGTTTFTSSSTLSFGTDSIAIDTRTVNNAGTATWTSGSSQSISIQNNGSLNNQSGGTMTFDQTSGSLSLNSSIGTGTLSNAGTMNKTGAGGLGLTNVAFNNSGTLNVSAGSIVANGGGAGSGSFNIASGAFFGVSMGNYAMAPGVQVNGGGLFRTTGGFVTFNGVSIGSNGNLGAITSPLIFASGADFTTSGGLTLIGGWVSGEGSATFGGNSSITGGSFRDTGSTTFASSSTTAMSGSFTINARGVNNAGVATWTSGDNKTVTIEDSGSLNNQAGGIMTFHQSSNTLTLRSTSGTGKLSNMGTMNKTGNGTVTLNAEQVTFDNAGLLNLSAGTFNANGGVTQHSGSTITGGTWNVSNGATLNFSSGSNLTTIGSAASVSLDGATSTFNRIPTTASTLTTNQGSFTLKNDRDITTANAFANSGTVSVQDSATTFKIGATGNLAYTQTAGVTAMVNGAIIDPGVFNLNAGELRGTGTIQSSVIAGPGANTIAPGLSPGTLTINGSLTLSGTSTLAMEIGGVTQGSLYDYLDVNGVLTLAGLLDLDFINAFDTSVTYGDIFTLATADSAILGAFSNVASGSRLGTNSIHTFEVWYGAGSPYGANNLVITGAPEPTRAMLMLLGLTGLMLRRRRGAD